MNFSIYSIHVITSFPSNFLISIFRIWFLFNPKLESLNHDSHSFCSEHEFHVIPYHNLLGIISCRNFVNTSFKPSMSPFISSFKPFFKTSMSLFIYAFKPSLKPSTSCFIYDFKPSILTFTIASNSFFINICERENGCTCYRNFDLSRCISSSISCVILELFVGLMVVSFFFCKSCWKKVMISMLQYAL